MEYKLNDNVIAFKTLSGEDVLGLYAGETELEYSGDDAMMIYRPIIITLISNYTEDGVSSNYFPQFYFPYGELLTPISYKSISHQELANPFFTRLYHRFLGEMITFEESRQERISKVFDDEEERELIEKTASTSMFIDTDVEYQH